MKLTPIESMRWQLALTIRISIRHLATKTCFIRETNRDVRG